MSNNPLNYGAGPSLSTPLASALDANSQRIENLPRAGAPTDPVRSMDMPVVRVRAADLGGALSWTTGDHVTLTNSATGALVVDGVSMAVGDLVLLPAIGSLGAAHLDHGIFRVVNAGAVGVNAIITRDDRFTAAGSLYYGQMVIPTEGTLLAFYSGVPFIVATTGTITPGSTAVSIVYNFVAYQALRALDLNDNDLRRAVLGGGNTNTTFAGASIVPLQTESGAVAVDAHKPGYRLTGTGQAIDLSGMQVDQEVSFWDSTGAAPSHTFDGGGGTDILYAGSGASPGQTAGWPSGATVVVIHRVSSTVFLRS